MAGSAEGSVCCSNPMEVEIEQKKTDYYYDDLTVTKAQQNYGRGLDWTLGSGINQY